MKDSRLEQPSGAHTIEIPSFADARGTLAAFEWAGTIPFIPERFYFIRDTPKWARRACHAHYEESEAIFSLSGRFTVLTDDGHTQKEWLLDQPDRVLLIPPMVWHELYDFEPGALCAVLASHHHDSRDYCRDYDQFLRIAGIDSRAI